LASVIVAILLTDNPILSPALFGTGMALMWMGRQWLTFTGPGHRRSR
jgi:hypothetical protein